MGIMSASGTQPYLSAAQDVIARCHALAKCTEEPGYLTRTFLSEAMRAAYAEVRGWMEQAGMEVRLDHAGNLRGWYKGTTPAPRLIIGSHLDSVPRAGMFDGPLGVLLGVELLRLRHGKRFRYPVEVIGFSEEEGVRFGVPFIGSRAVIGELDSDLLARRDSNGISVQESIHQFGLTQAHQRDEAAAGGYLEFHIEQGPVLENLRLPLGVVETIVGQSRLELVFTGHANHAGTTPMHLRRDALAAAAEWTIEVERRAVNTAGLAATVGKLEVRPGAGNIVPGLVTASLDVRHAEDAVRDGCVNFLIKSASNIAAKRGISVTARVLLDQPAVKMNDALTRQLASAVERSGFPVHRMDSGAGHDAMILARRVPAAMLFLRSPGGISHHPDESVLLEDVAAALAVGTAFLEQLEQAHD